MLRVAGLLAARLCHDLVGPAAAVDNGVELIVDMPLDPEPEAMALVAESSRQLTRRLRFYRFAYGYEGRSEAAGRLPCELAARYFEGGRIACDYDAGVRGLDLAQQQLGCNLLIVGAAALPRGGRLALAAADGELRLEASGEDVHLATELVAAMNPETPAEALTAASVQAYFAGLLARALGRRLVAAPAAAARLCIAAVASSS